MEGEWLMANGELAIFTDVWDLLSSKSQLANRELSLRLDLCSISQIAGIAKARNDIAFGR
jgi:hypothetical protein